jgi:hypothetical protein
MEEFPVGQDKSESGVPAEMEVKKSLDSPSLVVSKRLDGGNLDLPILIRNYGSWDGGIEKKEATMPIDAFLHYQELQNRLSPSCQIQGETQNRDLIYTQLRTDFKTHPDDRDPVVNIIDLPISHDLGFVNGIKYPEFLDSDLVEIIANKCNRSTQGSKDLTRNSLGSYFSVSSLSGVHMDHKGVLTWACVTSGMKCFFPSHYGQLSGTFVCRLLQVTQLTHRISTSDEPYTCSFWCVFGQRGEGVFGVKAVFGASGAAFLLAIIEDAIKRTRFKGTRFKGDKTVYCDARAWIERWKSVHTRRLEVVTQSILVS